MLMRTILAAFACAAVPALAAELSGLVTEVHDGDTLTLVNWQATYKIRLADIDAPEWKAGIWQGFSGKPFSYVRPEAGDC